VLEPRHTKTRCAGNGQRGIVRKQDCCYLGAQHCVHIALIAQLASAATGTGRTPHAAESSRLPVPLPSSPHQPTVPLPFQPSFASVGVCLWPIASMHMHTRVQNPALLMQPASGPPGRVRATGADCAAPLYVNAGGARRLALRLIRVQLLRVASPTRWCSSRRHRHRRSPSFSQCGSTPRAPIRCRRPSSICRTFSRHPDPSSRPSAA